MIFDVHDWMQMTWAAEFNYGDKHAEREWFAWDVYRDHDDEIDDELSSCLNYYDE